MRIDKGWIAYGLQEYIAGSDYLDAVVEDKYKIKEIELPKCLNLVELAESFNRSEFMNKVLRPKNHFDPLSILLGLRRSLPLYLTFHAADFRKDTEQVIHIIEVLGTMKINQIQVKSFDLEHTAIDSELVEAKAHEKVYEMPE